MNINSFPAIKGAINSPSSPPDDLGHCHAFIVVIVQNGINDLFLPYQFLYLSRPSESAIIAASGFSSRMVFSFIL